ncbi:unnamed protein product [Dibothriocephalus latus]|uniref:Uncharacterized protein n=1 Tax=Dibothriocephalus latus TaxID=60516 RepID=A0A3P7P5T1_DIBLA|nr:unnamed protein product [Dibothriocephalus latus]
MNNAIARPAPYQTRIQMCESRSRQKDPQSRPGIFEADAVWKPEHKTYSSGILGLHDEILDFVAYISPTPEEHWVREIVVAKVKNIVYRLWPECQWEALPLRTLENALRNSGVASEIRVLSRATVPIVKLTDVDTGLHVDISFNMINSVRAAEMIRDYMGVYPCLQHLVFVLKQFLLQRDLNEVWTGGISSYALILMTINFLQNSVPKHTEIEDLNLGTLLIEVFELYGLKFNYMTTAIRVSDGGAYVRKEEVQKNMEPGSATSILCIEDPLCPGNDVGRRSYGALQVKKAFGYAFTVLKCAVLSQPTSNGSRGDSILARIIRISHTTEESRLRVRIHAQHVYSILPYIIVPFAHSAKANQPISQPASNAAVSVSVASSQNSGSVICAPGDQTTSSASTKERIVVSARGFASQPPLLRTPCSKDVLRLSNPMSPYLFPQPTVVYDPNTRPLVSLPTPIPATPSVEPPVFILWPPAFPPMQGHAFPLYSTQPVPPDSESLMSSKASDVSSDDNSAQEVGSAVSSSCEVQKEHDSTSSEDRQKKSDVQQQSADRNKSSSAATNCAGLEYRLAPLRLVSSDQNMSCSDASSVSHEDSVDQSTSPTFADSPSGSNNESYDIAYPTEAEEHKKSESNSNLSSKVRCPRRRRRPLRRGSNACNPSTEDSEALKEQSGGTANMDSQFTGCSLKRKCSQLRDPTTGGRLGQSTSSTSLAVSEKQSASDSGQSQRGGNAWFPIKSSVRTSSSSPAKSDDHSASLGRNRPKKNEQCAPSNSSKEKFVFANVSAPPALKRLATGRPR